MAKKMKRKVKAKKAKKAHSPTLSAADRSWLVDVMNATLAKAYDMAKKEPRSQKRRGQVTGGDR